MIRFYPESFQVSTPDDLSILVQRNFQAPRQLVFDAHTKPELVRRWLLGPDGWTMPVCEIDLRIDGLYRYVWRKGSTEMGLSGRFLEIESPAKLVATEKFDDAWYPGEAIDTTVLEQHGEITRLRLTVRYQSKEARDIASRSGMDVGMAAGYSRLEVEVLANGPMVIETQPQLAAAIPLTIPRSEIQQVMGPALMELKSTLAAQGVEAAGPWFTHHLRMQPDVFDFEVCIPVTSAVTPAGRVVMREFRGVRAARKVYCGGYEGLGPAWGEFHQWMEANGLKPAPDLFECYAVGPETSANPADWRTELTKPLL